MSAPKRKSGWRTSEGGSLRFNRDFSRIGVGRIVLSSHTTDEREFRRRDDILTKLAEAGQIEVLRDFKAGRLTIEELVAADRAGRLSRHDLSTDIVLRANLWDAIEQNLPQMGKSIGTRRRYEVTFNALRRRAAVYLPESATLRDLERVHWARLQGEWARSAADWNHVRRAVSALLSTALRDKYHPLRRRVLASFPKAAEQARVPDLSLEVFRRVLAFAPPHARSAFMVLALTGMRVGEYLACTRENLMPETSQIRVPGTKTGASASVIRVAVKMWPHVFRGIPSPLQYKWLRLHWIRACAAAGAPGLRLHDIRHAYAQWAVNAGVPESKVQTALRHTNPSQTRQYAAQRDRGEVAETVGSLIGRVIL